MKKTTGTTKTTTGATSTKTLTIGKLNKESAVNILRTNVKQVTDKSLKDRIVYTCKNVDKATLKDLRDLVKETQRHLGDKFSMEETSKVVAFPKSEEVSEQVSAPTENKVKPKKTSSVQTPKAENLTKKKVAPKTEEEPAETPKTKAKAKKSKKDNDTDLNEKAVQLAKIFPETLEIETEDGTATFKALHDEVKTIEDLEKLWDKYDTGALEVAFYWTKRHLRQFPYFNGWLGQPKSFKNDLDMAQIVFCSDKVCYAVSDGTDAIYTLLTQDIPEDEDEKMRFSSGLEYQFYINTQAEETSEDDNEEDNEEDDDK